MELLSLFCWLMILQRLFLFSLLLLVLYPDKCSPNNGDAGLLTAFSLRIFILFAAMFNLLPFLPTNS